MKKIKQSFVEVISGEPRKEHYIDVTIVIISIAIAVGLFLTLVKIGR